MTERTRFFTILMADDDPDDIFVARQAFEELGCFGEMRFVEDGEDLLRYLRRSGKYSDAGLSPRPAFILLDLNMPKKDGREALAEIKTDPDLWDIPLVIWTTLEEPQDMDQCKGMGADIFVTKPVDYNKLLSTLRELIKIYCFE